jgi:glycosyltransferase involved in cell wall biosynthesis
VRIFIWHGYLLHGTGSNEYTRALARTLARHGHDVTVFCADDAGGLDLGGATVRRPVLPGRLPVFVLDAYEGMEPVLLPDMPRAEVDAFVAAQAAAIRAQGPADLLIANHVLLGGPVGAASGLPFVVKAHGSELEYAMRGNEALCAWARDAVAGASAVIAGSEHIRDVLAEVAGIDDGVVLIPPGVDTDQMRPRDPRTAQQQLIAEALHDAPNPPERRNERLPDDGNADRFAEFFARSDDPIVTYVGKLSEEKGVSLLLDALAGLPARTIIVGFGPARADLEAQAARLRVDALFTGPLQHRHLCRLWPLAAASVVPSVFPEAFGMVAAEAASCGCPPVIARHSGLAEIAEGVEAHLPDRLRIVSFLRGDAEGLRRRLEQILALPEADAEVLRAGCRRAVEQLWSWDSVAERMVRLGVADRPGSRSGGRAAT